MTRTILGFVTIAALAILCGPSPSSADMRGPGHRPFGPPTFMRHLYPPRLVLRNQEAIGLTTDQRQAITGAINESRTTLTDLERKREAAAEAVDASVADSRVDEPDVLAKATALIAIEQEIKQTHLRLLIRVKNQLTPEQQRTLDGLREEWRSDRRRRRRDRLVPDGRAPQDGQ